MKLFRVTFRVRPAVDHPIYWDWQFGLLSIWLFAASDDEAGERALQIINQLPYEIVGDWYKSLPADSAPPYSEAEKVFAAANPALQTGLALFVLGGPTGVDEPENFHD